jgi:hypothetical protein
VILERVENWDRRLVEFVRLMNGQPFEWGRTDCATLVRRGLKTEFGEDVWKGHVGTWKTKRGALGVSGRTDYEDALRASGATEVGIHYAWSGDVALASREDDHGMFSTGLLVPTRKVLTSTPETGVVLLDKLQLQPGTKFFRYGVNPDG